MMMILTSFFLTYDTYQRTERHAKYYHIRWNGIHHLMSHHFWQSGLINTHAAKECHRLREIRHIFPFKDYNYSRKSAWCRLILIESKRNILLKVLGIKSTWYVGIIIKHVYFWDFKQYSVTLKEDNVVKEVFEQVLFSNNFCSDYNNKF